MFLFAKHISLPDVGRLSVGISISRSRARNSAVAVELLVPLELEIKEKRKGSKSGKQNGSEFGRLMGVTNLIKRDSLQLKLT
jgi:hypothetical protein